MFERLVDRNLPGYALISAWIWLVLATFFSWGVHPRRPSVFDFANSVHLLRPYLVHLAALGGFLYIVHRSSRWRGAESLLFFILGLGYVLAFRQLGSNELAGILLFFIPWAVAIATTDPIPTEDSSAETLSRTLLDPSTNIGKTVAALAALLFAGMLFHTSSRSGLGACILVLIPLLWILGRRGRRLLFLGTALSVAWLLRGGWGTFLEFFVFDGKLQRLTFYTFLTGRPHIWHRHAQAVVDMPFTGVGLGASEHVVRGLYPFSRFEPIVVVEDAHNFWLHIATELGLPSLAAVMLLLLVAWHRLYQRWRSGDSSSFERTSVLGIAGGLAAYLIYGLVDVVAFGSLGSLPFWCLLGLACQAPVTKTQDHSPVPQPSNVAWSSRRIVIVLTLGCCLILGWGLRHRLAFNLATLQVAHALFVDPEQQSEALQRMQGHTEGSCHGHYFVARLADAQGDVSRRDAAYSSLLSCSDDFDDLVAFLLPEHHVLATEAHRQHPQNPAAHLWRARQLAKGTASQRQRAQAMFRSALALDPSNGRAWIELGQLLHHQNRRKALIAYAEACKRGDYYGQGCWQAGAAAIELGDLEAAIQFYRTSRMPGSQAFAQGLEAQRKRQVREQGGSHVQ